jgi:type I restriction enzyme M protein
MLIHDIDNPQILHGNSLERNVREYSEKEKFDVILMNPPYGGNENEYIKNNFPSDLRTSETADLFMSLIMYRLKDKGRAAVIVPDGFLFGVENAKFNIKKKLFNEFNVHTIVRLPGSVFSPYTTIATNILFFDKTDSTKHTWFFRLDKPEGYLNFSKTRPMLLKHFDNVISWWEKRTIIEVDGIFKAKQFTIDELRELQFNIDLVGYPIEEKEVLDPHELITLYKEKRQSLELELDQLVDEILAIVGEPK